VAMPASGGATTPGSPRAGASSSPGKRRARRGDPSPEDDTAWGSDSGGWAAGTDAGGAARQQRRQRLFVGHTAYVVCLALGGDGRLLASGQEGRQPVVRLWDFGSGECLAILCGESPLPCFSHTTSGSLRGCNCSRTAVRCRACQCAWPLQVAHAIGFRIPIDLPTSTPPIFRPSQPTLRT
jgi:WD40 repeat protein